MPYTNDLATTSVGGTWSTPFSYSSISLIAGIPHSAQLEIERIFTTDRDGNPITDFLNNTSATVSDKRNVFIIPTSYFTFDETTKTITATSLNNYDFNPDGVGVSNVKVPNLSGASTIKIRRKSVSNTELVSWTTGTKLTSNQLNLETKQLLYLIQEILDRLNTEYTATNITFGSIPDYSITPAKLSEGGPTWTSGGALTSTSIQNTPIGSTTRSTGAFTTLAANGATSLTSTLVVSGDATMTANTASSSTSTGTLVVTGGVGVSGTIYAGGFNGPLTGNITGSVLTAAQTNITSLGTLSSLDINGTLSTTGITSITNATASTSTSTGALKVSGGVGIVGDIYAGSIQNTPIGDTTRSSGAFTTLATNGATTMTAGTASTSTTTGTLVVTGGVGISGTLYANSTTVGGAASGTPIIIGTASSIGIYVTSAAPTFTAAKGSLCINTGATAINTRLYINNNGSTGWSAVTSG
jgi:hypothetical protein